MSFSLRAKRVLAGVATGALALSMMPASMAFADEHDVCAGAPDSGFTDKGTTHADNIDCLYAYGITTGQTATTFGTFADMTRGQASTFFVNFASVATDGAILDAIDEDVDVPFTDIDGTTHESNIEAAYRLELISGTTATTYSPNESMTREQFATVLYNAHESLGVEFDDDYADVFTDTANSVHEDNINALAGEGIISGTTATTFSPQDNVERGQLATLFMQSAQLLDDLGLWTDERPWVEEPVTNQTFVVTPDDLGLAGLSDGDAEQTDRSYTVEGLGDVDEVTLAAADPGEVTVDNGIVSFEGNDSAELNNDPDNVEVTSVVVDGTTFTGIGFGDDVDVTGVAEFEFTVASDDEDDAGTTVPVVYVEDEDDDLAIDEDGEPTVDFGVGGQAYFVDPQLDTDSPVQGIEGGTVDVEVQVLDDDVNNNELEVAGIGIEYRVADTDDADDYDDVRADDLIASGTVETDAAGVAALEVADTEDGDEVYVYFKWTGEGALDGLTALSDEVTVEWQESDGLLSADSLEAELAESYLGVGMTAEVSAEVTDSAGVAIEGAVVEFSVDRADGSDFEATRTTDADGEASYSYSKSGAADVDDITVSVIEAPDGEEPGTADTDHGSVDPVANLWVGWFVEADDEANFGATADDSRILSANAGLEVLFVADGDGPDLASLHDGTHDRDTMEWVDYTDADLYYIDGDAEAFATFEDALFDDDVYDFAGEGVASFESENRDDRGETVRYNLNSDSASENSIVGLPASISLAPDPAQIMEDDEGGELLIIATVEDAAGDPVPDGTDVYFAVTDDDGTDAHFAVGMPLSTTGGEISTSLVVGADQEGTVEVTVTSGAASATLDVAVDTTAD